ncbi:hypothetical protein D3C81_288130 [compost metagenome]
MINIVSNGLFVAVYGIIVLLLLQRWMESLGIRYSFSEIPDGRKFQYSLGLYGGKIRLIRSVDCTVPSFIRRFDGWEIVFPQCYTDEQMDCYVMTHNPPPSKNTSHSKDLEVYREVVIRQNDKVLCVAGQIYCSV